MRKNKLKFAGYLTVSIILTLGLSISMQSLLAAWTAPTANPPGGNPDKPIDESVNPQTKLGNLSIGGNFYVGDTTDALFANSITGNVGIGTLNPAANLHIYTTDNKWRGIIIDAQGVGNDQRAGVQFITKGDGSTDLDAPSTLGWIIANRGNAFATAAKQNDLFFSYWDGTVWRGSLSMDSVTGNVGIGTMTPTEKLEVDGNIKINNEIIFEGGGYIRDDGTQLIIGHN